MTDTSHDAAYWREIANYHYAKRKEAEARADRWKESAEAEAELSTYIAGLLTDEQRNDPNYPWHIDKRVNEAANAIRRHGDREAAISD